MTRKPSRAGAVLTAALALGLLPAALRGEAKARDLTLPLDKWDPPQSSTSADVVNAGPHGEPCLRLVVSAVSWESQLRRTLAYPRAIAHVVFEGSSSPVCRQRPWPSGAATCGSATSVAGDLRWPSSTAS